MRDVEKYLCSGNVAKFARFENDRLVELYAPDEISDAPESATPQFDHIAATLSRDLLNQTPIILM